MWITCQYCFVEPLLPGAAELHDCFGSAFACLRNFQEPCACRALETPTPPFPQPLDCLGKGFANQFGSAKVDCTHETDVQMRFCILYMYAVCLYILLHHIRYRPPPRKTAIISPNLERCIACVKVASVGVQTCGQEHKEQT